MLNMTVSKEAEWIDLWRRVACQDDLKELLAAARSLLGTTAANPSLWLCGFDAPRESIQILAEQPACSELSPLSWIASSFAKTDAWVRGGEAMTGRAVEAGVLVPGLALPRLEGLFWAAPLRGREEPLGILLVAADRLSSQDLLRCGRIAEMFQVALSNSRQWREVRQLREAAEADRRKLLFRLDRQDISESIVGAETGLRTVMERVGQVSRSDAPVLLLGETGSGKEVVARAVHSLSQRANGPFIRVNCGAIPSQLVDSQLFGHERGSFTGAYDCHKGWFERADGGTLFLDEIGELPQQAQVRLLRILQDGTFERVGGSKQLKTDLRIVAATHRDLRLMVRKKEFREDLWYRIAVFPIAIPPLRDRREDIPALAAHFALGAAKRLGSPPLVPSSDDLRYLLEYDWPGNIRELAAVIERAAILGNGRQLNIRQALGSESNPRSSSGSVGAPDRFPTLDQAMVRHIEEALERTAGRVDGPNGAARLLAINPSTLRARMRKLGIRGRP
jgi:transcriptional regulator with GAF, ATPase, and Fis domain